MPARHNVVVPERAVVLDPQPCVWSSGAPEPLVLSSERRTFVVFTQPDRDQVSEGCTAIEFVGCLGLSTGFPNDEALYGHTLWGKGLSFYQVHEVIESSWLNRMREIERHHSGSPDIPFEGVRHFVLTFHDSTVEALARDLVVAGSYASAADAITEVSAKLLT